MREEKGFVEVEGVDEVRVGVLGQVLQVQELVPVCWPDDDRVRRIDLPDGRNDLLLNAGPGGVGDAVWLVQDLVEDAGPAVAKMPGHRLPGCDEVVANPGVCGHVRVEGVVVENDDQTGGLRPVDDLIQVAKEKRVQTSLLVREGEQVDRQADVITAEFADVREVFGSVLVRLNARRGRLLEPAGQVEAAVELDLRRCQPRLQKTEQQCGQKRHENSPANPVALQRGHTGTRKTQRRHLALPGKKSRTVNALERVGNLCRTSSPDLAVFTQQNYRDRPSIARAKWAGRPPRIEIPG